MFEVLFLLFKYLIQSTTHHFPHVHQGEFYYFKDRIQATARKPGNNGTLQLYCFKGLIQV